MVDKYINFHSTNNFINNTKMLFELNMREHVSVCATMQERLYCLAYAGRRLGKLMPF